MTDPYRLDGQCIVVTGGTRGIGRGVSLALARGGARVVAVYARNDEAAQSLARESEAEGLTVETLRADLTLAKGIEAVTAHLPVDGTTVVSLVHCAATGVHRPLEALTGRHWDWTLALNARAFFELVQALRPLLRAGSAIVPVSSAGAVRAVPAYAAVGASKGALEALARHLAAELAPHGVQVNILAPGSVRTEAWAAFPDGDARLAEALRRTPTGRLVTADEVGLAARFLCSPAARSLAGHTLVVDGGARIVD